MSRASLQPDLGTRLRELRLVRELRLADVSAATGISVSFLSLVESGKNDVTISRLARLCSFYGIGVADILSPSAPDADGVMRRATQPSFSSPAEGMDVAALGSPAGAAFVPYRVEFAPGAHLTERIRTDRDVLLVVTDGAVEVTVDDGEAARLEDGDAIALAPGRLLDYRNPDDARTARALVVVARG